MTPKPWARYLYDHGGSRIIRDEDGKRTLIADTYQRGDANLFYHALDLLEAAKAVVKPSNIIGIDDALQALKAAIAEAEEETP